MPVDQPNDVPLSLYDSDAPAVLSVVSNERITPDHADEVRHIVLDRSGLDFTYREGQSIGIVVPLADERGRVSTTRYFSVASSRQGDDGTSRTLSLCVKRAFIKDPETAERRPGIASSYVCDLRPGDSVSLTGPFGNSILLPDDAASNLILVATGTGVAPFRAFLKRILVDRSDWTGTISLFHGVKCLSEALYRVEFETYRRRPNFQYVTALSREQQSPQGDRMYVDHRMAERVAELWDLLGHERTYLYICGIKGMEERILRVLDEHASAVGLRGDGYHDRLRASQRLRVETY